MITINTDSGLVRIESWDDILSQPGFAKDIDPGTIKLQSIIGNYAFDAHVPCGLSTCHQPHGKGYLVAAQDGRTTNIGKDCGKKYFSVDFIQMRKAFDRDYRAMQRREYLLALKHRIPSVTAELAAMKAGPHGASWMRSQIIQLLGEAGSLPRPIINAVKEAVRNNGVLTMQRKLTEQQREDQAATTNIAGLEHLQRRVGQFVTEHVGQLDGHAALFAENGIRAILVDRIEPFIVELDAANIDSLTGKELSTLYNAGSDFDALLDRLRKSTSDAARLLRKQNIEQLLKFATSDSDKRAMKVFANALPI